MTDLVSLMTKGWFVVPSVLVILTAFYLVGNRNSTRAKALQESEERFRNLVQYSSDIITILESNGNIRYVSPSSQRILGYAPEELIGKNGFLYLHPQDIPTVRAKVSQTIQQPGVAVPIEFRFRHQDGSWIDIEAISNNLLQESNIRGVVVNSRDVSDRKRVEAERAHLLLEEQRLRTQAEEARQAAETANRLKDDFLAIVSHELRTPLNAMLGWTQILQRGKLDPPATQRALDTIERNAKLQNQLIEDILDVSRIIAGKLRLEPVPVDVGVPLELALGTVRPTALAKSIHLDWQWTPTTHRVWGDANRLQQIFWNLLSNAIKFTPSGGTVTVQLCYHATQVQITIVDTGIGIEPTFLPYVFERFRQAESNTTHQQEGLGLGLAIVRNLVESHGGRVQAFSLGLDQGTAFTVTLPLTTLAEWQHLTTEERKLVLPRTEIHDFSYPG